MLSGARTFRPSCLPAGAMPTRPVQTLSGICGTLHQYHNETSPFGRRFVNPRQDEVSL